MTVVILSRDLLIASRILAQADAAGRHALRIDDPADMPPPAQVEILFVDWAGRLEHWGLALGAWQATVQGETRPRVVVFGPHTDLDAHTEARDAGLGPMIARSKLMADLPQLLAGRATPQTSTPR